jgi:hypothetical protein
MAAWIEQFWFRHRRTLLWVAICLMILASVQRLNNEFRRLLFDQTENGAIDLKFRYNDVHRWFSGLPVYQDIHAIYPPASYLMLWPLLGWLSLENARWLWAVTSVAAMIWLMALTVKQSGAPDLQQRSFVALLVPSMYATGATIGNGQLILHLLPFLIVALLLNQKEPEWGNVTAIVGCFLFALVKPALAAPFIWMILFTPPRLRAFLLVTAGYLFLTVLAAIPQNFAFRSLISDWLARGSAAAVRGGYANLHSWLTAFHLQAWILPASFLLFVSLGVWIFRYRKTDFWILMGVTAYFARFWIYHRLYDDLLILIPMIALFRIAREDSRTSFRISAGLLLLITWAAALAPARLLSFPAPYNILFEIFQTATWMMGLVFLIYTAKERSAINGIAG